MSLETPVAFIVFNRPEQTERVFRAIARARPAKLLVVADGPRNASEQERCSATRAIIEKVDWDCQVLKNYSDVNLGCKNRVSSGLDWVFEQSEEAIILEDDCLPDETFFPFCTELLQRFRNDERVGMICGSNFHVGKKRLSHSYFFGLHVTVWGWATWRRAWKHYDVRMRRWPELRETKWLADLLKNPVAEKYWQETFEDMFQGKFDTWDYQMFFSWWSRNMLAAIPDRNLISNIGFGSDASRTRDALPTMANLPVLPMTFPLSHPPDVLLDLAADKRSFRSICPWIIENQNYYWQVRHRLTGALPDSLRTRARNLRARLRGDIP